jgi:RHS repeat-associated protein
VRAWNARNQLVSLQAGAVTNQLGYDARDHAVVNDTYVGASLTESTGFIWADGAAVERRVGTIPTRLYRGGVQRDSTDYLFVADHLGTTRAVTDASASPVTAFDLGPFGASSASAPWPDARFIFGILLDPGTPSLMLAEFRAYSPKQGRWISEDPLGLLTGMNKYSYLSNSPLSDVDLSGLAPWYGNFCGPGNRGGAPIDDVDSACQEHDNCYGDQGFGGANGYFHTGSKRCDLMRCDNQLCDRLLTARIPSMNAQRAAAFVAILFCNRRRLPPPQIPTIH